MVYNHFIINEEDEIMHTKMKQIKTVKDLIEKLQKLPEDYEVDINVDNAYTSCIQSIYINEYYKKQGRNIITIKV
jgi:hypothetical protein